MEASLFRRQAAARRAGVALIMTLITLSILVILLVGFLSMMLTERRAAGAFEDAQRAKLIAQGAVSHAIDLLRTNIPEPARLAESPLTAPGENWIVNPGRLTVIKDGAAPSYIALHTGEVTEPGDPKLPRDADSVDLNQPLPGQTTAAITGTAETSAGKKRAQMRIRWVNSLADPSQAPGPKNRLAGRYAFWMDDESARLNFNTALGKPAPGKDLVFDKQLSEGFLTPLFKRGSAAIVSAQSAAQADGPKNGPEWALGRPQSVNFDTLFEDPNQLQHDKLLDHLFLSGFNRYPEAILDFITLKGQKGRDWFEKEKFNVTFFSRSPEFNAFNRSRLFTTYVPLSLEGGPSYQHPFLFETTGQDGKKAEILHLNSLLGTFGFTSPVADEDGATVNAGNIVNQLQVDMLTDYLRRTWPGYKRSFFDKYGEAGCRQLALNAVLMARMATTQINNANLTAFSSQYSLRTTSANYSAPSTERPNETPERMYWRYPGVGKNGLFLPQTPGPHITEVRLFVKSTEASVPPRNDKNQLKGYSQPRYIQYWYEVEYYMHPFGPVVDLGEFPIRMDYLEVDAQGIHRQQFGPSAPQVPPPYDSDWDYGSQLTARKDLINLRRFLIQPTRGGALKLGPLGSKFGTEDMVNRRVVKSPVITIGQRDTVVPCNDGSDFTQWDPFVFDAAKTPSVTVDLRFRPGMGIFSDPRRPRQMIPLGETREDTLKATFDVSLIQTNRDQAVSWQISDPRLSHDLAQWEALRQGPGNPIEVGTSGMQNANEPGETSLEKSKFRYLLRAPVGATIAGFGYDRPNEYDPRSRISSPGYWSLLHTGMQSGRRWQTLDFGPESGQSSPPDWLLLDLLGATYPMANDQWRLEKRKPDEFSTASFMNSTAGQINLNSRIYPRSVYFNPPERTKPLEAVFRYLPGVGAGAVANDIVAYQSDNQFFDYVGEVANVPALAGSGATPWQKEFALRNMAGVLTTKSNTFGLWGVAQVVKKVPKNAKDDQFEYGDQVLGEKRFYALIERYIWTGRDGVPGNGHVASNGKWDRLALQTGGVISMAGGPPDTLFQLPGSPPLTRSGLRLNLDSKGSYPPYDGPEPVQMNTFTEAALGKVSPFALTRIEDAYNPPQALIKYRVVSFKYLDE